MSNTNSVFKTAPVEVQKRTGFNMDHLNCFTGKVGQLVPVVAEPLMPGDKVNLGLTFRVQMPPMATDFLGKVDARVEAFFVPLRILYGGWKNYMLYSGGLADQYKPAGLDRSYLPTVLVNQADTSSTLADYLGIKMNTSQASPTNVNADMFLAYHKIYDDWYRDARVQTPVFAQGQSDASSPAFAPGTTYTSVQSWNLSASFMDGTQIGSLRQRNYEKDYFTNAFVDQYGGVSPMKVSIQGMDPLVSSSASSIVGTIKPLYITGQDSPSPGSIVNGNSFGSVSITSANFSIPQLRLANSLQKFAEQNCLAGGRYKDTILANYGVVPSDALVDRCIYLGRMSCPVYNNSVMSSNQSENASTNPFIGNVGASAANSKAVGQNRLLDKFEAKEHGVLMVLFSLVPHATYATGTNRQLLSNALNGDGFVDRYCVPNLANVGNQPIYCGELDGTSFGVNDIFGYTDRFAEYKFHADEVHGLLRAGKSLQSFCLQRNFSPANKPTINSSFIRINVEDMNNVTAVSSELSQYGYWCDMFVSETMVRPLPAYSIPSLCDEKHLKTISIERGGTRL